MIANASFFILLTAAGNDTTRNAISHGMVALSRYPDERATWWNDFDEVSPTAVEEIVHGVKHLRAAWTSAA